MIEHSKRVKMNANAEPEKGLVILGETIKLIPAQQLKVETMEYKVMSIRPFIGAENFELSRSFYQDLGFEESVLPNMSYFKKQGFGFYLQDAYVRDWVDNTMIFMEVENVDQCWNDLVALDLTTKYEKVKLTPIRDYPWGRECFLHDPSGILWHFGEFRK